MGKVTIKGVLKKIGVLLLLGVLLIFTCNTVIESGAKDKTYTTLPTVPKNRVGLLLGTAQKLVGGQPNPYYTHRIEAAVALFKANKIEYVLVSGDNGTIYYNEPTTMKKDLMAHGLPADRIFLDYAGFRTLDSMVRANVVFGLDTVTVISQKFHNERAIYIANRYGLHAIGYNARDITGKQGLKVHVREYLARVKVFIDLLLKTEPKYYGNTIEIK
ncbi:SanA/YdcF family protein [Maribacter polysaccharolyticus]|uniref:SanA/YdcF family protein n=1 Tax=Maribacter polysaccharolyticus TaxID=3020831 RepID=UPI00237F07E9|nr:ElyC/SanA/YdcF family protein [Maribacter polysaccharolyticus]MDE3741464.1 ElyC/SanA/YdcF family protein [Maribacter polysaccharolyticus]